MKKIVIKYGLWAALITLGLPLIGEIILQSGGGRVDFTTGEIIGYASMAAAMIFVFLGMKKFRDEVNNGKLSFLEALKVGLLIAVIPAVGFGLYSYVYSEFLHPEFMDEYYTYSIEQMKESLPEAEFEAKVAELEAQKEMFMNPFVNFFVMFATVFIIGVIFTLVSSLILKTAGEPDQLEQNLNLS
ncbi:MAG: DUF4199 domain-containing protein [Bacteroidetes bacterium]|nr:DUF4199 domain-containing protein [Bacteroidota bacterium]